MKSQCETRCVDIGCKRIRRVLTKLSRVESRNMQMDWTEEGGEDLEAVYVQVGGRGRGALCFAL